MTTKLDRGVGGYAFVGRTTKKFFYGFPKADSTKLLQDGLRFISIFSGEPFLV